MSKDNENATCIICCHPMNPKMGCTLSHIIISGKRYERIKAGSENDYRHGIREDKVCHDCNVGAGQYHHLGCDSERCPACQDQLFLCDCNKHPLVPMSSVRL